MIGLGQILRGNAKALRSAILLNLVNHVKRSNDVDQTNGTVDNEPGCSFAAAASEVRKRSDSHVDGGSIKTDSNKNVEREWTLEGIHDGFAADTASFAWQTNDISKGVAELAERFTNDGCHVLLFPEECDLVLM
jgi:hypothetical protein